LADDRARGGFGNRTDLSPGSAADARALGGLERRALAVSSSRMPHRRGGWWRSE
jgi:hypothetical protein